MKRIAIWSVSILLLLVFIGIFAGYFLIKSYLSGDQFREILEHQIAAKTHTETVTIAPLAWGGSSISTESIKAKHGKPIQSIEIGKFDASWDKSSLWDQHLKIKDLSIDTVKINLFEKKIDKSIDPIPMPDIVDKDGAVYVQPDSTGHKSDPVTHKPKKKNWIERNLVPNRFSLEAADIRKLDFIYTYEKKEEQSTYAIEGTRVHIAPDLTNNEYKMTLREGLVRLPLSIISIGHLDSATARYRADRISVTNLSVKPDYGGDIDAEGEWDARTTRWHANLVVRGVHCNNLIDPDWKKSIDGIIEGTIRLKGDQDGLKEAEGSASIDKGVLTALPVLDTLAAFTNTSKFKRINFNSVKADFKYSNEVWQITNIVLACDGLLRIEGWISIGDDESLSGRLQVGIVPGVFAHIPGAEERIFLPGNNAGKMGLLWTNVNLSGTVNSPREDLTARLIAAAGDRLFQIIPGSGKKALLFSTDVASRVLGIEVLPNLKKHAAQDEEDQKEKPVKKFIEAIPIRDTIDKTVDSILKF